MDLTTISLILNAFMAIIILLFANKYKMTKTKFSQIISCLQTIEQALQDDKITPQEIQSVVNVCKKIIE